MPRTILFLTVPHFPITVERAINRKLLHRPVVLVPTASPRARCISVSDEAAQWGVRYGMTLPDAQRACRDLDILFPNPSLYGRASSAIRKLVDPYTPLIEPNRSGQIYLDLTGCHRLSGPPVDVAETIRMSLNRQLRLPAEAGIAVNKLVSRVAAFSAKDEGLVEVSNGEEEPFMAPHRSWILPAADRKVRSLLTELNLRYVRQVRDVNIEQLLAAFGLTALKLNRQARGIDPTPVLPPENPPEMRIIEELPSDSVEYDILLATTRRMTYEGMANLHGINRAPKRLQLTIFYSDGQVGNAIHTLRAPTDLTAIWLDVSGDLFVRAFTRRVRVRRIELLFTRFAPAERQLNLWETVPLTPVLPTVKPPPSVLEAPEYSGDVTLYETDANGYYIPLPTQKLTVNSCS